MNLGLFLFGLLACGLTAHAQQVTIEHKNFTSLHDALVDVEKFNLKFNETSNFPSLAFGLAVKGKPVFRKAWGLADLENYTPAKLTTKYRLASISKSFTSAIVGSLVDQGLVHYDDPISKYLSEAVFPAKKWDNKPVNITLRNLLSHMAGVHTMDDMMKDLSKVELVQNVTQTIRLFKDEPLKFAPGSHWNYSNYGYQLVGAVIESVTKKPFQLVANEFLHKNGLNSSYTGNLSVILHDVPRYYVSTNPKDPKENIPTAPFDELVFVEGHWPAGGFCSTVDDMLHYGQLLIDSYKGRKNAILSQKTIKEMWSSQVSLKKIFGKIERIPFPSDYAFGWFVGTDNPKLKHRNFMWHSGGLIGATSMLFVYPEEEIVGVAFVNKGGVNGLDEMIVNAVENVYHLVK